MNTGLGGLSFLQGTFLTQELNQSLLHCRRILHQVSYQGSPFDIGVHCKRITTQANAHICHLTQLPFSSFSGYVVRILKIYPGSKFQVYTAL